MKYDVGSDDEIQAVMDRVDREFDGLDTLVHSVAFAPKEALDRPYLDTTRQAFTTALGVSAYSLIAMARSALPLMKKRGGGSIIALTYLGSERVFPNYNVMGVAKAALEASVRYLAHNLGDIQHKSERDLGRPDQDPGGQRAFEDSPKCTRESPA